MGGHAGGTAYLSLYVQDMPRKWHPRMNAPRAMRPRKTQGNKLGASMGSSSCQLSYYPHPIFLSTSFIF